jgi:hypothetical protein
MDWLLKFGFEKTPINPWAIYGRYCTKKKAPNISICYIELRACQRLARHADGPVVMPTKVGIHGLPHSRE